MEAKDEDPMAYLAAKRQEMAAMAELAGAQTALAQNVASRMDAIERLLEAPPTKAGPRWPETGQEDPEVAYWQSKLKELSAPIPGTGGVAEAKPEYKRGQGGQGGEPSKSDSFQSERARLSPGHAVGHLQGSQGRDFTLDQRSSQGRDLSPAATLSSPLLSRPPSTARPGVSGADPEVEYWRRKIAELSQPSNSSPSYHSTSLPTELSPSFPRGEGRPPLTRMNLSNPRYKTRSLADEPLSWEGTASFADENIQKGAPPRKAESKTGEDEEILLGRLGRLDLADEKK